jgi:alkyl hydroperoxide reductase subunit AhpC
VSVKLNQEIQFKKMKTNYGYLDLSTLDKKYKMRLGFSHLSNFTKLDVAELLLYNKLNKFCEDNKLPFYFFSFNMDQPKSIMQFYHQITNSVGSKITIPMIYDDKSEMSNLFDMDKSDVGSVESRLVFITDEDNKLKYICQNDINIGTNPTEIFRIMLNMYDRSKSKLKKFYAANSYPNMIHSKYEPLSNNQLTYSDIYNSNIIKMKKYFSNIWIGNTVGNNKLLFESMGTDSINYDLLASIENYENDFLILNNDFID